MAIIDKLQHYAFSAEISAGVGGLVQDPVLGLVCSISAGLGWEGAQWEIKVNWAGLKDSLLDLGFDALGALTGFAVLSMLAT